MSGTFEQLAQKKERLEKRLDELIKEHQDNDAPKTAEVEKRIDRLDQFLKSNEPRPGRKHKENKSNVIDNDSQLMTTSHGVIQGYNAQAAVDSKHQIIVFADAGDSGQDDEHLIPVVDGVKENLKAVGRGDDCLKQADMLSDANYFSPTNLKKLMDEDINCCIPDKDFRKRDPRFIDGEPKFSIADFHYDPERDVHTCPAGKELSRRSDTKRDGEKYYRHYAADEKSCQACEQRRNCLSKKTSKRRWLSVYYDKPLAEYVRCMIKKMDSDEGRRKYDERFGMVEPVFANIRTQKRMDRFTLRGKRKVNIQWMLYCLVHNIEKCIPFDAEMTLIAA
jgi:hypothetical protein